MEETRPKDYVRPQGKDSRRDLLTALDRHEAAGCFNSSDLRASAPQLVDMTLGTHAHSPEVGPKSLPGTTPE